MKFLNFCSYCLNIVLIYVLVTDYNQNGIKSISTAFPIVLEYFKEQSISAIGSSTVYPVATKDLVEKRSSANSNHNDESKKSEDCTLTIDAIIGKYRDYLKKQYVGGRFKLIYIDDDFIPEVFAKTTYNEDGFEHEDDVILAMSNNEVIELMGFPSLLYSFSYIEKSGMFRLGRLLQGYVFENYYSLDRGKCDEIMNTVYYSAYLNDDDEILEGYTEFYYKGDSMDVNLAESYVKAEYECKGKSIFIHTDDESNWMNL